MEEHSTKKAQIQLNESAVRDHLGEIGEDTLNNMLDAEADRLCNAEKYQRNEARTDTRAGHYQRKLHTKAGAQIHTREDGDTPALSGDAQR